MRGKLRLLAALALICAPLRGAAQLAGEQAQSDEEPSRRGRSGEGRGASSAPESVTEPPGTVTEDSKLRRARKHFKRGVLLYGEDDYDGALAEFTRANELVPNYRILYNLGQIQLDRHDYVGALRLFGEYLERGGREIPAPRRQATERECASLAERIATVHVESNVDGAELVINGTSRGVVPRSRFIQLNPGLSRFRLRKRGYEPVTRQLTVAGGDALALEFWLDAIDDAVAFEPGRATTVGPQKQAPSRTGLWLSVAIAPVLAGATVTFAVLTLNAHRDLDDELRQSPRDRQSIENARSRLRTFAAFSGGLGVATALEAVALIYFIVSDPQGVGSGSSQDSAAAPSETHLVLAGSGLSLMGGF